MEVKFWDPSLTPRLHEPSLSLHFSALFNSPGTRFLFALNWVNIHGFDAYLIFTHRDSLFWVLLDAPPRQPFSKSVDRFKDRLKHLIGRDLYANSPAFVTCKTNSLGIPGRRNDFVFILKFEVHRQYDARLPVELGVIEDQSNNMPGTPLGSDYASERFGRQLAALIPSS